MDGLLQLFALTGPGTIHLNTNILFSDYFNVPKGVLENYGALNICVEADLPLFIDPFLLYASAKSEYRALHEKIVRHLLWLKKYVQSTPACNFDLLQFPEIKQNWLGLCKWGNSGNGLGPAFARKLVEAFEGIHSGFAEESVSKSAHIEKLALTGRGIGRDFVNDFSANLIVEYFLEYTENFAKMHLQDYQRRKFSVRCEFDSKKMQWRSKEFELPYFYKGDRTEEYVLLTPIDMLTRDETFICYRDLKSKYLETIHCLKDVQLKAKISAFFAEELSSNPKSGDFDLAVKATLRKFPVLLDHYIEKKELEKDRAITAAALKIELVAQELTDPMNVLCRAVFQNTEFYSISPSSFEQALKKAKCLKFAIENSRGHSAFYPSGDPILSEDAIQRIFRVIWFAMPSGVEMSVPPNKTDDYKAPSFNRDAAIIEFKLAGSVGLDRYLQSQIPVPSKALKSISEIVLILCYSAAEVSKVTRLARRLSLEKSKGLVIVDATDKQHLAHSIANAQEVPIRELVAQMSY